MLSAILKAVLSATLITGLPRGRADIDMLYICTQAPTRAATITRDEQIRQTAFSPAAFMHRLTDLPNDEKKRVGAQLTAREGLRLLLPTNFEIKQLCI